MKLYKENKLNKYNIQKLNLEIKNKINNFDDETNNNIINDGKIE